MGHFRGVGLLTSLSIVLAWQGLYAQSDVGGYAFEEAQNFDQSGTATPTADPTTTDQFYGNVFPGATGTILTSSTLFPPTGKTGTVTFISSGKGISFSQNFSTQSAMDAAFGTGTYNLTVRTSTPNTYPYQFTLGTGGDDLTSIPVPQISNATWVNGSLLPTPTANFAVGWNTSGQGIIELSVGSAVSQTLTGTTTVYTIPANTLAINTAYNGILTFDDLNGGYQRNTHFSVGINDLSYFSVGKQLNYDQSSASTPVLDPAQPYSFMCNVSSGSNGSTLSSTGVIPPSPSTGTVSFQQNSSNGWYLDEGFTSKALLDAAFAAGTYNFTIQTATPNTYTEPLTLGADNYPPVPQITGLTNATWSNGVLQVTDYTKAVTVTWLNPGGVEAYFQVTNTSINSMNENLTTSFTIPAGTLTNNTADQALIDLNNGLGTTSPIPNATEYAGYQTQVTFTLQTGTPAAGKNQYVLQKGQVLVQTANSAPVPGSGNVTNYNPAPYYFSVQMPVAGSVAGPNSTNFTLAYNSFDGDYEVDSGAFASQTALNAYAPDGSYIFPSPGGTVTLTGDLYPSAAQVTQVNGATPVWDNQGQLVLDPTISNTITWPAVNVPSFATDGHETAQLEGANGGSVVKEQAGLNTGVTTPYTSLTIPAGTISATDVYVGEISYGQASTYNSLGTNSFATALYQTQVYFSAVALKPQTVTFPTLGAQQSGTTVALSATSSVGFVVSYVVLSGPATVSGNSLILTGSGSVTVEAVQTGNGTFSSASSVQSFVVTLPPSSDTPTMTPWALVVLGVLLFALGSGRRHARIA